MFHGDKVEAEVEKEVKAKAKVYESRRWDREWTWGYVCLQADSLNIYLNLYLNLYLYPYLNPNLPFQRLYYFVQFMNTRFYFRN